jgi:beta-galactosidase
VNNTSIGVRKLADFPNNTIKWHIPYSRGSIRAVAYNGSAEAASDELTTAGEPVSLHLKADRTVLDADGQDLSYVEIEMIDAQGVVVPDADRPVRIRVQGAGRFVCMDNGDTADSGAQLRADKPTFMGHAQAIIQAGRSSGTIRITASADGLPDAELQLTVR